MSRATWKFIFVLVSLWLLILGYMGWQLLSVAEDSIRNEAAVALKKRQMELLTFQFEELKKKFSEIQGIKSKLEIEVKEIRRKNLDLEQRLKTVNNNVPSLAPSRKSEQKDDSVQKFTANVSAVPPSKKFLTIRRRAEKTLTELWYFISSEVSKVKTFASGKVKEKLSDIMGTVEDMHHMLSINFEELKTMNGQREWLEKEHKFLSDIVQKRLHRLQHPKDCNVAKKLVCQLNKGCGYGCQVHHLMYCFIIAYGLQRTLILDSNGWRYSPNGWNGIFKPVSETCTSYRGSLGYWSGEASNREQNILLPIVDSLFPRPKYMPLAVPRDLAPRIQQIHSHPFVWWIGQFTKYLFRFSAETQDKIDEKRALLGFKKPIVGVQVRRTDKINTEAAFHSIEEYMYWVDLFYNKLERVQHVEKRRVFLATDDGNLLPEAKMKYENYEFISDQEISKSAGLNSRYSDTSLHGVVFDIQMLSECDYLVCTFSSQVCRVAYEIMQASQPDSAKKFQSLDDIYYFGGQSGHDVRAIYPHKAKDSSEIDLSVGDRIGIAGNHWDGFSKGTVHQKGREGLFPSYKVEDVMDVEDFPTYDEV
ncbi:alpha-(1,6)-fucosyltransferase-like [Montipora foliosa]|uniref:alpha-(1,6)-fucosyltransferase-like n=1 Tax=Montipora foliosa TaxID=591990 RepID=UPI0035F2088E